VLRDQRGERNDGAGAAHQQHSALIDAIALAIVIALAGAVSRVFCVVIDDGVLQLRVAETQRRTLRLRHRTHGTKAREPVAGTVVCGVI
jgi:ammonia channel protein AmtB